MIPVPPELAAAIEAPHRQPRIVLSVDWDRDGHGGPGTLDDLSPMVTSYRLDRSLDGALPEQVRLVTGAGSAAAKVTLARGPDTPSAAGYLSPLNPASPLAGKTRVGAPAQLDVAFATPHGPRAVRRLTGQTRTLTAAAGTGQATLSMLDHRERLRGLVPLPPIDGTRYGANATWIIGWALTVCGWTVAPKPRNLRRIGPVADAAWGSDAALCLPMHGSLWPWCRGLSWSGGSPDLGAYRAAGGPEAQTRPTFVPGPHLLGAYAQATAVNQYTAVRGTIAVADHAPTVFENAAVTGRLELWVRGDPYPATPPADAAVELRTSDFGGGTVDLGIWRDRRLSAHHLVNGTTRFHVFGPALPSDGRWHFVGIAFRLSGGSPQIVFRLDDTTSTVPLTLPGRVTTTDVYFLTAFLPVADLQLTRAPLEATWIADTTTVDVTVDPSTLELDAVPERDQREGWDLLREIAAAEQAVVVCDEHGRVSYRTRARLLDPTTGQPSAAPHATLTAADAITDIAVAESVDTVRTLVEVPYTAPILVYGYVWTLDQPIELAPGVTLNLDIVLDAPVVELDSQPDNVTEPPTNPASYLRANTAPDGTGAWIDSVLGSAYGFTTTGQGKLQVGNFGTVPAYLVDARLAGRAIRTRPAGYGRAEDPRLTTTGEQPQPLRLPASQWVQRADIAAALATAILPDLAQPRAVITDLAIRGDPRLQLGDRVRIVDRDGLGIDGHWWITGIAEAYTATTGYTMRITARQAQT